MLYNPLALSSKSSPERAVFWAGVTELTLVVAMGVLAAKTEMRIAAAMTALVSMLTTWYIMYAVSCINAAPSKGCKNLAWVIVALTVLNKVLMLANMYAAGTTFENMIPAKSSSSKSRSKS